MNELSSKQEINFGYLTFRAIEEHLLIRDYNPEVPLESPRDHRDYGKDLNLTSLVLDTLAEIGKKIYGKKRLRNTYPYDVEKERFLSNGFEEVEERGDIVWVREI